MDEKEDEGASSGEDRAFVPAASSPAVSPVPASIPSAIKAFAVTENDESTGGIIFAKHAIVARRIGAGLYADGEFSYVSCRRAPWADHCAKDGLVPASLCVWHGWHFECHYCGSRIDEDHRPYRSWTADAVIGHQNGSVFCDRSCELAQDRKLEQSKRLKERVLARYGDRLRQRFPGISVRGLDHAHRGSHVYVAHSGRIEQIVIDFDWPGQRHGPACFRWEKSKSKRGTGLTCCHGDKEAFEAFAAQGMEAAEADETQSGSAVGDSPIGIADAPDPHPERERKISREGAEDEGCGAREVNQ